jgi:hypothetical protein
MAVAAGEICLARTRYFRSRFVSTASGDIGELCLRDYAARSVSLIWD